MEASSRTIGVHVRPVLVTAILAAAVGASVMRVVGGTGAPTFAVTSSPGGEASHDVRDSPADGSTPSASEAALPGGASRARDRSADSDRAPSKAVGALEDSPSRAPRAVVYVAGDVRRPGVYALAADARVADALRAAGGLSADADAVAVDLAARVEDGEEIAVPARGMAEAASVPGSDGAVAAPRAKHARRHHRRKHGHKKRPAARAAGGVAEGERRPDTTVEAIVDVNAANAATLATLPGIGAGLADRIVSFRSINGPFASADELLDVNGVTGGKVDRLLPFVTFGRPRP